MPLTGLIDLHSHLLPGIDDGCRTVDESLACVRALLDHGFTGTVCTPHMGMSVFAANVPSRVARLVVRLQEALHTAGLDYQLWSGGELRIAENSLEWLQRHGVPTLGPSRHVLVDFWGAQWPAYADRIIEHLIHDGYQPILAHPERMDFDDRHWDDVLHRLQQSGVVLQGNLKCLAGHEGRRVARRALRLLTDDRYRLLATDMHGTPDLADRLAGLNLVDQHVGEEKRRALLAAGPQQIVAGEPPSSQ